MGWLAPLVAWIWFGRPRWAQGTTVPEHPGGTRFGAEF